MLPTIPSLLKICDAFGVSPSQFFLDDGEENVSLTTKQRSLLDLAAKLEPQQLDALIYFLEQL